MTKSIDAGQSELAQKTVEQRLARIEEFLGSHLGLNITTWWMDQYKRLDNAVTEDSVSSMKAMIHEFITREQSAKITKDKGADGFDKWIRELLMAQRVYEYLLFVHGLSKAHNLPAPSLFPDAAFATRRWLRELCWNHEFQLVHLRQGGFYPEFTRHVNKNLRREAQRADSFAASTVKPEDSKELKAQAKQMRGCASVTAGRLAYGEFVDCEDDDPAEYDRIFGLAESQGYLPLDEKNFIRFWVDFLEAHERGDVVVEEDGAAN